MRRPTPRVFTRHFSAQLPSGGAYWTNLASTLEELAPDSQPIRVVVAKSSRGTLDIEASFAGPERPLIWPSLFTSPIRRQPSLNRPAVVVNIIPTGVRANIGGFAGDATPATNLLASACDFLVSNPNTVTASDLYFARENVQYVEGNLICRFMLGQLDLQPADRHPVGLVIEQPREERFLRNAVNAINAMRTVAGLKIDPVVVTDGPVPTACTYSRFGNASGEVGELDALYRALDEAAQSKPLSMGLVTTLHVPESVRSAYYSGEPLPNPWGSAEAILTHLTTSHYSVTAAHSPLLMEADHTMFGTLGDPRDGAELISSAYLCSMIQGLSRSPQVVSTTGPDADLTALRADDVRAIVMPASAVGNIPFFVGLERGIPLILVQDNSTIFHVSPQSLGISDEHPGIWVVNNYEEAAGLLLAQREGIDWNSLRRPIEPLHVHTMSNERNPTAEKREALLS